MEKKGYSLEMNAESYTGKVLEGKYRLIRLMGRGGMGSVYEARHVLIDRRLAVKLLHSDYQVDDESVRRFHREARTAAAIGHDHIVQVTDMGVTQDNESFIVMEYLEGKDLETVISASGALSTRRASHIMIQVLSALEAAHAKGIVHRDLKPANIFLVKHAGVEDYAKIVDFGISKIWGQSGLTKALTRTGQLLGTPLYMSPEQALGLTGITPASDVYSCGVILFEALTGKVPFTAPSLASLLVCIVQNPVPDPRTLKPGLAPELAEAVLKAMAKKPEDRFLDAASFRHVLAPFSPDTAQLTGLAATCLRPSSAAHPRRSGKAAHSFSVQEKGLEKDTRTPIGTTSTVTALRRDKFRHSPLVAVLAGLCVILVGVIIIAFAMLRAGKEPSPFANPVAAPKESASAGFPPAVRPAPAQAGDGVGAARSIKLSIVVKPDDTAAILDGVPIGSGSRTIAVFSDQREHEILFKAQGYSDRLEKVRFERDRVLDIALVKAKRSNSKHELPDPARSPAGDAADPAAVLPERPLPAQGDKPGKPRRIIDEANPW